jgi:TRAP-type uncharacterized transport system substrate-binding protein
MRVNPRRFGLFAAAAAFAASTSVLAAPTFINVLTGGTSGVYYPIGVAISQLYSTGMSDAKVSVQATKASVENLNLLQAGRGELAFALGDSVDDAWNGVEDAGFKAPLKRLRAVAATYPNYIQIVASQESGIKTLADLKGYEDMGRVEFMPFAESVELIKNRQLDATLQSAGLGMAAIRDLSSMMKLNFVPIPEDVVKKIGSSAYLSKPIPVGTYEGQDVEVPTAAVINILVTHDRVDDEVAYQMTKLIYDNLPRLVSAHSAAKDIRLEEATQSLPIPLHPGAERFYREQGLMQ